MDHLILLSLMGNEMLFYEMKHICIASFEIQVKIICGILGKESVHYQ